LGTFVNVSGPKLGKGHGRRGLDWKWKRIISRLLKKKNVVVRMNSYQMGVKSTPGGGSRVSA